MNEKEKERLSAQMKANHADPAFVAKRNAGLQRYWDEVRAGKRPASASKQRATETVADRMASLTAEEIVGAIQTRINELTAENTRLQEELAECRTARQLANADVFDLRKENRELAAQLREQKDRRTGLRLFAGQSR